MSQPPQRQSGTINSVFVLELLDTGELRTGDALFHSTIRPIAGEAHGLDVTYRQLHCNADLIPALHEIWEACEARRLRPVLHLDTHGSAEGLGRRSEVVVRWEHLVPSLRRINTASGFNLLVGVSACYGANLVQALDVLEPCPVLALVGPHEMVGEDALLRGYSAFYRTLFSELDLDSAIDSLALAEGWFPAAWQRYDARWYFAVTYGMFLRSEAQALPPAITPQQRGAYFEECKRRFFMFDDLPGNRDRFVLTEAECLALFNASGLDAA